MGPLFEAGLSAFVRCRVLATEPADIPIAAQWLEARLLMLVRWLDHMNARPLHRETAPYEYIIGFAGLMSVVQQAVDEFQEMVTARAEEDGENWLHAINIQVCDRDSLNAETE